MGKSTGFLEYQRVEAGAEAPKDRILHWREFHLHLPLEEQRKQGARCMDCGVPFCQAGMTLGGMTSGCPLHNLCPEWNDLVYRGNWREAYNRLLKTNSFPEFTSRVCPALCEKACTCGIWDDPVTTRENEYAIIEYAYAHGYAGPRPPRVRTGKRVAVVGSGPSGLACADLLNRRGHTVSVFERDDRAGGLLMYGIPNMKLEKGVVDRKIKVMEAEGVTFRTGVNVGKDLKAQDLVREYDAVVLACGSRQARDLKAPGRDAKGIYFAVDFLTRNTRSLLDSDFRDGKYVDVKGKDVVVVGGGDTGNDCTATAIRHGCRSVTALEMMPKAPEERAESNPWPQWPRVSKTDYGQEEAIALFGHDPRLYQTTVKEFLKDKDGNLRAVKTVQLSLGRDEKTGRRTMTEKAGSEQDLPCQVLIIAAGFLGPDQDLIKTLKLETTDRSNVKTAEGSYQTSVPKVFTCGDMHTGQSLVVKAIRQGCECAQAVDESLMGYTNIRIQ